MDTIDLYGTPMDDAAEKTLRPAEREGDVHIVITRDEYKTHHEAEWKFDEGVETFEEMDRLGNLWTAATDQLTGTKVLLTRMNCGGGCKCAMAVRLA